MKLEIELIDGMFLVTNHDQCTRRIFTLSKLMEMLVEASQTKNKSMAQMLNERRAKDDTIPFEQWVRQTKGNPQTQMQAAAHRNLQAQQQYYNARNDLDLTRGF